MKIERTFLLTLTLTLLIALNIFTLPCFAQQVTSIQLKEPEGWYKGEPFELRTAIFSPDLQMIAGVAWSSRVMFWDVSTGEFIRRLQEGRGPNVAFSPDGGAIARVANGFGRWDVSTGEPLDWNPNAEKAAFSPCGLTIAGVGYDHSMHKWVMSTWDVSTGEQRRRLEVPAATYTKILTVAFSPDGGTFGSVDNHGRVLLWGMSACEPKRIIPAEDVNGDGVVDILDLVAVAAVLAETGETPADVNKDGIVNILDLVAVAAAFE